MVYFEQEIEFNREEKLNPKATSEEETEADYPCDQQEDVHCELYDQSRDQLFVYECSECHLDIKSTYHCRECEVSPLVI